MNRTELIQEVHESLPPFFRSKVSLKATEAVVDTLFQVIMETTVQGNPIRIQGFGNITPVIRPPQLSYSARLKRNKMSRPFAQIRFRMCAGWKRAFKEVLTKEG